MASAVLVGVVWAGTGGAAEAIAQAAPSVEFPPARKNPLSRDAAAVQAGRDLYLERCAVCHGQDAKGSMAANLVRSRSVVRGSDAALYRILAKGIPGTEMPPQEDLGEHRIWQIVSYLHSLARPGLQPPVSGDASAGRELFLTAGCSGCHRVNGEGGFWGPALDSIAASKTSAQIRSDVLEPSSSVREGFRFAVARMRDGRQVEGLVKNQDTFTVQLLLRDGSFASLERSEILEFQTSTDSTMPDHFGRTLQEGQLQALLAFLDRQRDPFVPFERGFQNY